MSTAKKVATGVVGCTVGIAALFWVVKTESARTELRKEAYDAAKKLTKYRDRLKPLAALKGETGFTDRTLGEQVELRAKTFLSEEQAIQLEMNARLSAYSFLPRPGFKGKISEADFMQLVTVAGMMAQMHGPEQAGAWGTVAGTLPAMLTPKVPGGQVTEAQAEELLTKLFNMQRISGADFQQFASQWAIASKSPVLSQSYRPEELATLLYALIAGEHGATAARDLEHLTQTTSQALKRLHTVEGNIETRDP